MENIKRIGRTLVHKGAVIDLYDDEMILPDGTVKHYDFIKHNGASCVIPVLPDGRIVMVKQYRNALDRYTYEIPAGKRDSSEEDYMECAVRELKEETGFEAEFIEQLLVINTTVAFCDEIIYVYYAKIDDNKGLQHLDDDEYIDVCPMEMETLENMIYSGELKDAKTVAAILAYKNKYLN